MRAKALLKELMTKHPEWNWEDLEGQGFVEIMQAFRFAPEGDQATVVLAFTAVKEYLRRLIALDEQKRLNFKPQKTVYNNRQCINAFTAGIKEYQLRTKLKTNNIS